MKSSSVIVGGACLALAIGLPSALRAEGGLCNQRESQKCDIIRARCNSSCGHPGSQNPNDPRFTANAACHNTCDASYDSCNMLACQ
jgi:hypothetical protein